MRIILTGGTGFVGSHLVKALLKKGNEVILLKHKISSSKRIEDILPKLRLFDIETEMENAFNQHSIDVVIHLSGKYIKYQKNVEEVALMNKINIDEPSRLLEYCVKYNVTKFINTGTFFEYGSSNKRLREDSPIKPFNYYTSTKLAFEQILRYFTIRKGIRAVTLKLFSPYGEADNMKFILLVINAFLKQKKLPLTKGEQRLSFTYVEDVVDAYLKALDFVSSMNYRNYEAFNIGSIHAYSLRQIVGFISNISDKKNPIILGSLPYAKDEYMGAICDPSKAKRLLSWGAKTDIKIGLERTYKYYSSFSSS